MSQLSFGQNTQKSLDLAYLPVGLGLWISQGSSDDFLCLLDLRRWQKVRLVVASSETRGQSSNSIVWQPPFGRRERGRERERQEPRICTTSDTLRHTDIQANIHKEDFQGQSICTTMLSSYSKRITSSRQTVNH